MRAKDDTALENPLRTNRQNLSGDNNCNDHCRVCESTLHSVVTKQL